MESLSPEAKLNVQASLRIIRVTTTSQMLPLLWDSPTLTYIKTYIRKNRSDNLTDGNIEWDTLGTALDEQLL
eukprot:3847898-Ditylum_brightwellii.AAC.1